MAVYHLSPEDVKVLLGGFYQITGMVEGTFVTLTKDAPPFSTTRSSDNKIARLASLERSWTMQMSLAQSTPTNDVLTKIWQVDEITLEGKFPIFIKDDLGSTLFFATNCWISSVPEISYSNNVETRTWTIQCTDCYVNIGSNDGSSTIVEDVTNILSSASPTLRNLLGG